MKYKTYLALALFMFNNPAFADTATARAIIKVYTTVELTRVVESSEKVSLMLDSIKVAPNQMLIIQREGNATTISSGTSGRISSPKSSSIEYFF